jgi:hypothetical protein
MLMTPLRTTPLLISSNWYYRMSPHIMVNRGEVATSLVTDTPKLAATLTYDP